MVTARWSAVALLPLALVSLLAADPVSAQKPDRLAFASCADAARPHLAAALMEIENIGATRADPHLDAALAADPGCPFARALHAFGRTGLAAGDRLRELDRAVVDAAAGDVAELVAIAALREFRRPVTPARAALIEAAARVAPDEPYFATVAANQGTDNAVRAARLQEVVNRFPDYAAARNLLGYALYRSGSTAEGLREIGEYVRLLPDHPNSHDSYAELVQLEGRLDEAEGHYRRALELDPDYDQGHIGLAEVAELRGDRAAARGHIQAALSRVNDPARRWPHLRALAFNAAVQGDLENARRYLGESTADAEKAANAAAARNNRWFLAFLEAAEGNAERATREWTAIRDPDHLYAGLGDVYVYAALGDAARAAAGVKEFERSAAANPTVAADAVALARTIDAAVRGDVAAARTQLGTITTPDYRVIGHAYLARALRKAGDRQGEALALKEIDAYRTIDLAAAYARRIARP